jgi:DNA recombination protein RmuC
MQVWFIVLAILTTANLVLLGILLCRRPRLDCDPLRPQFDAAIGETRRVEQSLRDEFSRQRDESTRAAGALREEVVTRMQAGLEGLLARQRESLQRLDGIKDTVNAQLEKVRQTVETKLADLQSKNDQKLEEMRRTVDEKLQTTLERRLGESFKLVSERLEQVHKGLGEMQAMASSVGDLKRVLTNAKLRGTWGEIQLGALLEQILTSDQYAANVAPNPSSGERVEFAIRLPGPDGERPVWLPIDAKFPQEDYLRLIEAADKADAEGVAEAGKALETRLKNQARDIHNKYVAPPHTTDFAILFLATEGLYAEALRRPGLAESLQREFRVVITGPTNLAALLNSLQMGFRTLAIQQRSSEVWKVLGAVKTEFGKFGEVLSKVKKKLEEASSQIDETERRTRAIDRKLREVEALPAGDTANLLPEETPADDDTSDDVFKRAETPGLRADQNTLGL